MPVRRTWVLVGVFIVGIVLGGGAIYALTRPTPSSRANADEGGALPHSNLGSLTGSDALPMTFRGDFDGAEVYAAGDVVTFKGAAYIAGSETKDAPPDNPWSLVALQDAAGVEGPAGPQGVGVLSPNATIEARDLVVKTSLGGSNTNFAKFTLRVDRSNTGLSCTIQGGQRAVRSCSSGNATIQIQPGSLLTLEIKLATSVTTGSIRVEAPAWFGWRAATP